MAALLGPFLGPLLVLTFCLSQAVRDVYFGHVFQDFDFFAVILLAFSLSTVIFGAITVFKAPADFKVLRGEIRTVLAMNVATALAWSSYFFALTHLEPAIVNTVHSGMGPLTVLAIAACGMQLAQLSVVRRGELCGYAGIALSIAALGWVVLTGRSGLPDGTNGTDLASLMLLMISGASITISLLYSKRLHDRGVGPEAVTAVRYLLLILVAAGVEALYGRRWDVEPGQLATLALASTALIVLPLFALQVGIALTAPLTAHVIRALGPVCVFALEQIDGRIAYSTPTLICIIGYSMAAIVSNLAHGWRKERPAVAESAQTHHEA
jgi:drug/metabolite transporter (DMT)-like permease